MNFKFLPTWGEEKNKLVAMCTCSVWMGILSLFLLPVFFLYWKCFSFNNIAYPQFLISEITSLCIAHGLQPSKQIVFVPGDFAPASLFQTGDLSLMLSLTSQIYSCLKTLKATTQQCFFKDITYSHKNNRNI